MSDRRQDFELLQRFVRHGEQSAFADVRRLLNSAPGPKVEVNLPALYAEAQRRQQKQVRRWRRAAYLLVGAAALALVREPPAARGAVAATA